MRELLLQRGSFQMRLSGMIAATAAALFVFATAAPARDAASAALAAKSAGDAQPSAAIQNSSPLKATQPAVTPAKPVIAAAAPITHGQANEENIRQRWHLGGLMLALIAIAIWYLRSRKRAES